MHIPNLIMRHFLPTQVGERFYIINEGEVSVRKDGEELTKLKSHEYTLLLARKHMYLQPRTHKRAHSRVHVHLRICNKIYMDT